MVSYQDSLNYYLIELNQVYRRVMDTPLDGLLPEETMLIKQFQMRAKTSKDKLTELRPQMLRFYESADLQGKASMREDLENLKRELESAWATLEEALQKR